MKARIENPATSIPGVLDALQALGAASGDALPGATVNLVHLRASQINGCSVCCDMHFRGGKQAGESDERLSTVAAWRGAPYFDEAERAALALTEAATRLCDRSDPVPDEVWDAAAKHYDEQALGALAVHIALINAFNRLNVTTGAIAGAWTAQWA
jgi:AhpD family alkylhydroperoxidase